MGQGFDSPRWLGALRYGRVSFHPGKTTVANVILDRVGADKIAFLTHDAYYKDLDHLPRAQRDMINFDHPDSLETTLFVDHIKQLSHWQTVEIPIYDFTTHTA